MSRVNEILAQLLEAEEDDFDFKELTHTPDDELFDLREAIRGRVLILDGRVTRDRGHYVHERTTTLELEPDYYFPDEMDETERTGREQYLDQIVSRFEKELSERIIAWNHKIYKELEASYEGEHGLASIASSMEANPYEFTEDGQREDGGGFRYSQLSDTAKARAREWWNEATAGDNYFAELAEPVLDEWRWLLDKKGFEEVEFAWSGFWSQGDGASFTAKHIDFAKFFEFPDPLEFPETDRDQLSEALEDDDVDLKDLGLPPSLDDVARTVRATLKRSAIHRLHITPGALVKTDRTVRGLVKARSKEEARAILSQALERVPRIAGIQISAHIHGDLAPGSRNWRTSGFHHDRWEAAGRFPFGIQIALTAPVEERYGGAAKERAIFYHGTSSKLIPKILSQGLIPDPKVRAWADDPNTSVISATRQSISGIYVTTNLMTATGSAQKVAQRDKARQAVVVLSIQPRSLVADEDDVNMNLKCLEPHLCDHVYSHIWPYFVEVYGDRLRDEDGRYHREAEERKNQWVDRTLERTIYRLGQNATPELKARVRELLYSEGYRVMLTRMVSYITDWDMSHWKSWWNQSFGTWDDAPQPPDSKQAEAAWLAFSDKLSRTLKDVARPIKTSEWSQNVEGRVLEPIGFTGSNRILCVAEVFDERDPDYRSRLVIHYGEPPEQFIKDWKEGHGPLDRPDSIVYKNDSTPKAAGMEMGVLGEAESHFDALARTGFWGTQAAGGIFIASDTGRILIGFRSSDVLQPHTWGGFGGAIDEGEAPATAALREMKEETRYTGPATLVPLFVFKKETFRYHNFAAIVPAEFKPTLNWENENAQWVKFGEWPTPLHFGLAALLQHSGRRIQELAGGQTESLDDEFGIKGLDPDNNDIYLYHTFDVLDDPEVEPVWTTEGPFNTIKSAVEWAMANMKDFMPNVTLAEIKVLSRPDKEVLRTYVLDHDFQLREPSPQGGWQDAQGSYDEEGEINEALEDEGADPKELEQTHTFEEWLEANSFRPQGWNDAVTDQWFADLLIDDIPRLMRVVHFKDKVDYSGKPRGEWLYLLSGTNPAPQEEGTKQEIWRKVEAWRNQAKWDPNPPNPWLEALEDDDADPKELDPPKPFGYVLRVKPRPGERPSPYPWMGPRWSDRPDCCGDWRRHLGDAKVFKRLSTTRQWPELEAVPIYSDPRKTGEGALDPFYAPRVFHIRPPDPGDFFGESEDDFDLKAAAEDPPPRQRWMFQLHTWPTCKSINYFAIDDPAWRYVPGVYEPDKMGKPLGSQVFPKRTKDSDLILAARAQIRQFKKSGHFDRTQWKDLWDWMRYLRGHPEAKLSDTTT